MTSALRAGSPGAHLPGALLSAQLRERTRPSHVTAERAFALPDRVASPSSYTSLLVVLQGFYLAAEARLEAVAGWSGLTPALDVRARRREFLLRQDLLQLGVPAGPVVPDQRGHVRWPPQTLASGLGWLYVLEGSALGGQVIAARARRVLGPDLPVAFFSSASRADLRGDWSRLRDALDAFGESHPEDADEVVAAADAAFRSMTDCLSWSDCLAGVTAAACAPETTCPTETT